VLRLDRLATLYVMNHVWGWISSDTNLSLPVLMYHSVTNDDESRVRPYYRTNTTPETFAVHMRELREAGYSTLGMNEAAARLKSSGGSLTKSVVVTFDDGYLDFLENAMPILARHGFTATVFLPTAYIGKTHQTFKGKACLNWDEVRQLKESGISFGSHTVNHPQLRQLSPAKINEELVRSKQTIEQELGCAVESFAYPYAFPEADGSFKNRLREMLQLAGYTSGVCTTVGRARPDSDPFFLKRLPVNSLDDLQFFRAKLDGAYDWLAKPQYVAKLAKNWIRTTTSV
jgi:peptidoglycan/xylan/chitin deacetylase (PgdA/CDA1 family)